MNNAINELVELIIVWLKLEYPGYDVKKKPITQQHIQIILIIREEIETSIVYQCAAGDLWIGPMPFNLPAEKIYDPKFDLDKFLNGIKLHIKRHISFTEMVEWEKRI